MTKRYLRACGKWVTGGPRDVLSLDFTSNPESPCTIQFRRAQFLMVFSNEGGF